MIDQLLKTNFRGRVISQAQLSRAAPLAVLEAQLQARLGDWSKENVLEGDKNTN